MHSIPPRPRTGYVFKRRTILHVQRSNSWFHTHLKTRTIVIKFSSDLQAGLVLCRSYVPEKVMLTEIAQIKQNSHLKQCIYWGV
jgi:hypothetical protein